MVLELLRASRSPWNRGEGAAAEAPSKSRMSMEMPTAVAGAPAASPEAEDALGHGTQLNDCYRSW